MKLRNIIRGFGYATVVFCSINQMYGQQDPQYTQYMYNTININPAYAGSRGVMSIFGLYRTQWVGLDGAPKTAAFSVNTPINNSKLGLGVSFVNEAIGAMDENTISADLSYTIDLGERYKLAFGIKGSANLLNVDYTKLNKYNPNDPMLANNIENQFTPNVGAGVYLHSEKTYLGLSVPNFLETERYDDNIVSTAKQKMHFYLMGGHVFDLSPSLKFKPAFLVKAVSGAPLQADITANFMFIDKFVIGGAYRWDAAFSGLVGFQVTDGLFIGYSYDAETTKLANYNSGSHEIFLRFELFNRFNRITTPRFF
ncbi:type IX secretion system membrane protein PorP/SprF [Flavobacterium sp. HSC-61S13]|uniref:PorP/SprF family type IX secretion system membrane protein n=1 Tax=Flavobacterium sp. HSC-61S13 TaxID=2910963 RepID=UPI00209EDED8|nr:type IX secretion system membrane protein PorP/SprF [Flavobacterium sp. HSC-61S13]MCP1997410.1 type IX secretion system PorP/SprF family membrane protein [Flavobacterium sp. HSC-61S13]